MTGGTDIDPARYGAERSEHVLETVSARDDYEFATLMAAAARSLPTLGICRGLQAINVHAGGTLHQHVPEHAFVDGPGDALTHDIAIAEGFRQAGWTIAIVTNGSSGQQHSKIDRLGVRGLVDVVVVSQEAGPSDIPGRVGRCRDPAERCLDGWRRDASGHRGWRQNHRVRDPGFGSPGAGDADIDRAVGERGPLSLRTHRVQLERHRRMPFSIRAKELRHHGIRSRVDKAQAQHAGDPCAVFSHQTFEPVGLGEKPLGPRVQGASSVGQLDASGGPVKQLCAQIILELANLLTQRRLGHVQTFRRSPEVQARPRRPRSTAAGRDS
ncbi:putative glutamine amidotransferase [Nymphon striatum]|nr:putative glutamine amidotransferase [Nymphon striatum]